MGNVYVGADLRTVLRLKELIGRHKVRNLLAGQHPLAQGFVALDKKIIGTRQLSDAERVSLNDLKLVADVIFRYEPYWRPNETQFVADLLNATKCKAVLFEIEVVSFAIEKKVTQVEWPTYHAGQRDICTCGPDMLVECKLIRSGDVDRIFRKIKDANKQPRQQDIVFLPAVGFEKTKTQEEIQAIASRMRGRREWFEAHPEISGVLVVVRLPRAVRSRDSGPLGLRGLQFHIASVTEVINWKARNPLPSGFSFNW